MNHHDEALRFECAGDTLIGVLSRPERPCDVGVVILVGGPQYRVGGHRQYLLLARALAAAGHPVLRFDYRGNGDSGGARRNYECVSDDIGAAVDTLQRQVPEVRSVALWGLCGGASAALIYCHDRHDPRIAGLCLMNPWVRTETSLARTHVRHYYRDRLLQREFWAKLASGRVALGALRDFLRNLRLALRRGSGEGSAAPTFQERMASAWRASRTSMLLMISGQDYTAREFLDHVRSDPAWSGALEHPCLQRRDLPDADHTCSELVERARMQAIILEWLAALRQDAATATPAALPAGSPAGACERRPPTVHRTPA
jgi:exosortase A-associated hydrolase 1